MSSAPGQRVRDCLVRAHSMGSTILSDNAPATVLWEPMKMRTKHYQWTGCLRTNVG